MTTTGNAMDMLLGEMKRLGYSVGTISLAKRQCLRFTQEPGFMDRGKDESKYNELGKGAPAACRRLVALMRGEPPQWKPLNDRATALGPYYTSVVRQMSEAECWTSDSARMQAVSAARLFFRWLEARKCRNLETVTPAIVRSYYIGKASEVRMPKNLRFALKLVCEFLNRRGFVDSDCSCVFALRPPSYSRLLPALGPDEIAKVLDAIDRRTAVGRRDYAFVLIGATTGMRLSDIASIRLRDIDWRNGTMGFVQGKTSRFQSLPLLQGVGEAVRDYILHGRPRSDSDRLFLTACAPHTEIARSTMSTMFARRCAAAGLQRTPRDGRSFHSLRRSVGSGLVKSGVPLPTVSQVLGHRSLRSAENYLSSDVASLRECALGFAGIEPKGLSWN